MSAPFWKESVPVYFEVLLRGKEGIVQGALYRHHGLGTASCALIDLNVGSYQGENRDLEALLDNMLSDLVALTIFSLCS